MGRVNGFRFLRTTRANLNIQAGLATLVVGEPYYITDEEKFAVGLTTSTYMTFAKERPASYAKTSGTSIDLSLATDGVVLLNYASPTSITACTNAVTNRIYVFQNVGANNVTITRGMLYANASADQVLAPDDCMMAIGRNATTLGQLAPVSVNG